MDRWRQRLGLPPLLSHPHKHTHTLLATSFSQDNYLATSASPHSHAYAHTYTHVHTCQLWTLTRNDNSGRTHVKTCQGACIHSTTPYSSEKYGNFMKDTAANCSFASTDDRQTETVSYIFGTDSFLFVCLFACSQLQFILSPGPVNSIISDYFLISAAALIHLLVTYLFCTSQPSG